MLINNKPIYDSVDWELEPKECGFDNQGVDIVIKTILLFNGGWIGQTKEHIYFFESPTLEELTVTQVQLLINPYGLNYYDDKQLTVYETNDNFGKFKFKIEINQNLEAKITLAKFITVSQELLKLI